MPAASERADFDQWVDAILAKYPLYEPNRAALKEFADKLYGGDAEGISTMDRFGQQAINPEFARGREAFEPLCETASGRHTGYFIHRPVSEDRAEDEGEHKTGEGHWWDLPDVTDPQVRKKECDILNRLVTEAKAGNRGDPMAWVSFRMICTRTQSRYNLTPAYMSPINMLARLMPMGVAAGARITAGIARLGELCDLSQVPGAGSGAVVADPTINPDTGQLAEVADEDVPLPPEGYHEPPSWAPVINEPTVHDQRWPDVEPESPPIGLTSPHEEPMFDFAPRQRHVNNPWFLQALGHRRITPRTRHEHPIGSPLYTWQYPGRHLPDGHGGIAMERRIIQANAHVRHVLSNAPGDSGFRAIPPRYQHLLHLNEIHGPDRPYPPRVWQTLWPPPRRDGVGTPVRLVHGGTRILTQIEGMPISNPHPHPPIENPGAFTPNQQIDPLTGVVTGGDLAPGAAQPLPPISGDPFPDVAAPAPAPVPTAPTSDEWDEKSGDGAPIRGRTGGRTPLRGGYSGSDDFADLEAEALSELVDVPSNCQTLVNQYDDITSGSYGVSELLSFIQSAKALLGGLEDVAHTELFNDFITNLGMKPPRFPTDPAHKGKLRQLLLDACVKLSGAVSIIPTLPTPAATGTGLLRTGRSLGRSRAEPANVAVPRAAPAAAAPAPVRRVVESGELCDWLLKGLRLYVDSALSADDEQELKVGLTKLQTRNPAAADKLELFKSNFPLTMNNRRALFKYATTLCSEPKQPPTALTIPLGKPEIRMKAEDVKLFLAEGGLANAETHKVSKWWEDQLSQNIQPRNMKEALESSVGFELSKHDIAKFNDPLWRYRKHAGMAEPAKRRMQKQEGEIAKVEKAMSYARTLAKSGKAHTAKYGRQKVQKDEAVLRRYKQEMQHDRDYLDALTRAARGQGQE